MEGAMVRQKKGSFHTLMESVRNFVSILLATLCYTIKELTQDSYNHQSALLNTSGREAGIGYNSVIFVVHRHPFTS